MKLREFLILGIFIGFFSVFSGCSDDDVPEEENEAEIITYVKLTFTPEGDGDVVTAVAQDPDGQGPDDMQAISGIALSAGTEYMLTLQLENAIADEDLSGEVQEEAGEHMFFFSWTDGLFADPQNDGNIDSREDEVNYEDFDDEQLPLGLVTSWTTGDPAAGIFRIVLMHQPELKSTISSINTGETDLDIVWDIEIH